MIIKKRIFTFVFIAIILSIVALDPVSAEIINLDYKDNIDYTSLYHQAAGPQTHYFTGFAIEDAVSYIGLKTIVFGVDYPVYGNPEWTTLSTPITAKIDDILIGEGEFTVTNIKDEGIVTNVIASIVFDNWDLTGYDGRVNIDIVFTDTYHNNKVWGNNAIGDYATIRSLEHITADAGKGIGLKTPDDFIITTDGVKITAYNIVDFNQNIVYETGEGYIDLTVNKNNFGNLLTIKSAVTGNLYYSDYDTDDFSQVIYDYPVYVNITNPFTSEIWVNLIPKDVIIPEQDHTTYLYSVVDGTNPYKTLTANYVFSQENTEGVYVPYKSGVSYEGIILETLENTYHYALNVTKDGYSSYNLVYPYSAGLTPEEDRSGTIKLYPDHAGNISVTFEAKDYDTNTHLKNVKIIFNGETKYTNDGGVALWENITPGTYAYLASVGDYEDISGTHDFLYDTSFDLSMHKAVTATLQNNFVDALFPSKFVTTDYSIERKLNGVYQPYKTGTAHGGFMAINLEKGYDYEATYTADGYTPVVVNYEPFFEDVTVKIRLYPDMGVGNYTVGFQIRDQADNLISGAKVTANGEIKYSSLLGETSFGLPDGIVNYEVYKEGYAISTGTETVNSNMVILVVLTEEGIPSTPTPEIPDITDQPKNIIDSLKFSFLKMFGFNANNPADLIKTNLLFALILIMGCSALIAAITKDGIGAAIGGGFGFILTVALGLIPLWVLFTGIASVCIVVVLFKGGNGE